MNRDEKAKEVEGLKADLEKANSVFVVNFEKIPVAADWELRRQVRAAGGRYRVVKNTLAELSAKGSPVEPVFRSLAGPSALALTEASPVALAKVLSTYAKENPNFTFRAGWVEGRVISLAEFAELALLPGKEELLAKVLYLLGSPARGIAVAMQSVIRNLASVLDQAVKENKFSQ
ncbi:MAG: 50S ribosomal protein L10 [Terriglobia bacterium]